MNDFYYCEECNKVIPASEVEELIFNITESFVEKFGGTVGERRSKIHKYFSNENSYKNQSKGVIGYCPIGLTICYKVREISEQELYVYQLLGVK